MEARLDNRCHAEPLYKDAFGIDKPQLLKTMISLNAIYDSHQAVGVHLPAEAEFRSYAILLKV